MPVFGLDGGGTSARLRFSDAENVCMWEGRGEGINPNASSPSVAGARIAGLFLRAFSETGLRARDFSAGCAGVAGSDREDERAWLESVFRVDLGFACPLVITADPDIALAGALRSPEGIILIAGTGSVALARLSDGTRIRSGGLGHFLSDEGSAFWIAFQAIVRCLRSAEGRDLPTAMMPALLAHFGFASPERFVALTYREFDKARIASAAGLVESFRAAGDPLACDIFAKAAGELAALVRSVRDAAGARLVNRKLVLWGGVFENNRWLAEKVGAEIASTMPDLAIAEAAESAAYGACLLALRCSQGRS